MSDVEVTVSDDGAEPVIVTEIPGATESLIDRVVDDAQTAAVEAEIDAEVAEAAADNAVDAAHDAQSAADAVHADAETVVSETERLAALVAEIPTRVVEGLRSAATTSVETPAQTIEPDVAPERGHWLNRRWGKR